MISFDESMLLDCSIVVEERPGSLTSATGGTKSLAHGSVEIYMRVLVIASINQFTCTFSSYVLIATCRLPFQDRGDRDRIITTST